MNQLINEFHYKRINELMNDWINKSINQWIKKLMNLWVMNLWMNRLPEVWWILENDEIRPASSINTRCIFGHF